MAIAEEQKRMEEERERLSSLGSFQEEQEQNQEEKELNQGEADWAVTVSKEDGVASIGEVAKNGLLIDPNTMIDEERFQLYSVVREAADRLWVLLVGQASSAILRTATKEE